MKYEKPEVAKFEAIGAIASGLKMGPMVADNPYPYDAIQPAYDDLEN